MPQSTSALSEADDAIDLLVEENEKLQNQIRIIQTEREKEAEDMKVKIGKCKKQINLIDKENEELKTVLGLVKSEQNQRRDLKSVEALKALLAQQDHLCSQIDQEKRYSKDLDTEVTKYERLIKEKENERRSRIKSENDYEDLKVQVERKILAMETHLHHKVNGFCEVLAYSESIRQQIEKMRAERNIYVEFQRRLQENLGQLSKANSATINQATLAYEHRAEIKSRCQALVEKNEKEKVAFELETRDLRRIIDHNKQLDHFMKVKGDERTKWKTQAEARRQLHGSTGYIAKEQQRNTINECTNAITSIQKITGHNDVDKIIHYYNLNEDENFTIFNYVTEVNDQIEELEQEITQININATKCMKEQQAREEKNQEEMGRLDVRINRDRRYVEASEKRISHIHKLLDGIKLQTKNLAIKLDCDLSKISNMIAGDGNEVTERNLMLYFGVLEKRVDELLSIKRFTKDKTVGIDKHEEGKNDLDFLHSKSQALELPTLSDGDDDDSKDYQTVKPLTQAELVEKVNQKMIHTSLSLGNLSHLSPVGDARLTISKR